MLLVFLILAAQYESWSLPLAIVLIVPMCLLSSMLGVWLAGRTTTCSRRSASSCSWDWRARTRSSSSSSRASESRTAWTLIDAAIEACRLRLRPILMTSFAFIMGVVPLVTATGAGSEMRRAMGIAVFSGMLGVTLFGLFLTPVFFVAIEKLVRREPVNEAPPAGDSPPAISGAPEHA